MARKSVRRRPGDVRDAILKVLSTGQRCATVTEIEDGVRGLIGDAASSSVRSYLRLNSATLFMRERRGSYSLRERTPKSFEGEREPKTFSIGRAKLVQADCLDWLAQQPSDSFHAVVTDPPYGLVEYTPDQQRKLRLGKGGVWRIPPAFDGAKRSPLPRFTVLSPTDIESLAGFFFDWGRLLLPRLVPGANVVVASNPLLSYAISSALVRAGLERRGEIVRLVITMRGGDRPKAAHEEFSGVSVMPRSMWEPWIVFRRPVQGRAG